MNNKKKIIISPTDNHPHHTSGKENTLTAPRGIIFNFF